MPVVPLSNYHILLSAGCEECQRCDEYQVRSVYVYAYEYPYLECYVYAQPAIGYQPGSREAQCITVHVRRP